MTRNNTSAINLYDNDTASNLSSVCSTIVSTSSSKSILSAAEAQIKADEATALLNSISPHFSVKPTKYGGRSCFANSDLTQGTIVHECSQSLSSTIARPFKKQVCGSCFTFLYGKTLKFKLMSPKNQQHNSTSASSLALYFCSQACVDNFIALDLDHLYLESLLNLETLFIKGLTRCQYDLKRMQEEEEKAETEMTLQVENELKQERNIELLVAQKWEEAEIHCHLVLSKLKPKQRKNIHNLCNVIPIINEHEYLEIKYIIGILFQMYKHDHYQNNNISSFELQIFPLLQSNDIEKICKYPYLLHSYTRIYKFLRISTLDKLQPYITPSAIRSIIGRRLTNAYGIWSRDEPNGSTEFCGYSLYPSASFFNHSCNPNLIELATGARMVFKLLTNVKKDDELFISYIHFDNDDFEIRQKDLKEWFFDCLCERCVEEKNLKDAKK